MWKYCKKYQKIADAVAKELHYYAAYYIGKYQEQGLFGFLEEDSMTRYTGLTSRYLLVKADGSTQIEYVCIHPSEYKQSVLYKTKRCKDNNKGHKIYNELVGKLERGDYKKEEKDYLQYLYALDLNNVDDNTFKLLRINTIFRWLEAAYRHNDEIAIFRERAKFAEEGWGYRYIVAIKDIFLEEINKKDYMRQWKMLKLHQIKSLKSRGDSCS